MLSYNIESSACSRLVVVPVGFFSIFSVAVIVVIAGAVGSGSRCARGTNRLRLFKLATGFAASVVLSLGGSASCLIGFDSTLSFKRHESTSLLSTTTWIEPIIRILLVNVKLCLLNSVTIALRMRSGVVLLLVILSLNE